MDQVDISLTKKKWTFATLGKGSDKGYAARYEGNKKIYLHRVIMKAKKGQEVDHINGNTLDNRRANLRICRHKDNVRNQGIPKHNTSGVKGVAYVHPKGKRRGFWKASISVDGKTRYIGLFQSRKAATIAYNAVAKIIFGKFVRRPAVDKEVCISRPLVYNNKQHG